MAPDCRSARISSAILPRRSFLAAAGAACFAAALPTKSFSTPPATSSLPISVMLWTIDSRLPFDQRIAKASEAGYHAVELVDEYKDWGSSDFAAARQRFHRLNMVVDACSGINSSLCDPEQLDPLLAEVRAKLPVLSELECSRLILLTGNRVPGLSNEQLHANTVNALKRLSDATVSQNVEILLENIDPVENPKYFLTSAAEGFQIVREVAHPRVKFLYDFFHEQIAEGNLISKLEKNLDIIGLLHVADVPGRHEPGTGEINYSSIFRKIGQLNYSHYVAMEFIPTGDTVAALRAAREFAEKYFAEGRALAGANFSSELNHA
jgi:hydroxypyruvate isomerase